MTTFEIMETEPSRLKNFHTLLVMAERIRPWTGFYDFGKLVAKTHWSYHPADLCAASYLKRHLWVFTCMQIWPLQFEPVPHTAISMALDCRQGYPGKDGV